MKHRVIGIDLGTTYSAVAAWDPDEEQAVIIRDESGSPTTPSVVAYDPQSRRVTVGHAAKRNLPNNPDDTVIEIKREMGEKFRPETLEKIYASRHYQGDVKFTTDEPYKVYFADAWRLPQEISAFTLMRMKSIAEQELGCEICDAVITVPAYFKSIQKKATEEAAFLAGLYPRQLIPEPTAAAICYGVDRYDAVLRRYLVYDLGGGTFDVSIIEVEGENINVIATSGDPRLGGGDFDDRITEWAAGELARQFNITVDAVGKKRIKHQAEQVKIQLSTHPSVNMPFPEFRPQAPPVLTLTRERFDEMIGDLVRRSLVSVEQGLAFAKEKKGVDRDEISAVLLVGGSSQIPLVRSTLMAYFERDETFIRGDLDPAAVVARGAARLAVRFEPTPPPFDIRRRVESLALSVAAAEAPPTLITEHTLGIAAQSGREKIFSPIVPQGANIPVSITQGGYTNPAGNKIFVEVYQGESDVLYENTLVGSFSIDLPAGYEPDTQHFEVSMILDQNGLLTCTVRHVETGAIHRGEFGHQSSLGGPEALAHMREQLLPLFLAVAPVPPPPGGFVPPPPSVSGFTPPPPSYADSSAAAAAGASVAATPVGGFGGVPPPQAVEQSSPEGIVGFPNAELGVTPEIIEIQVEVPAQFQATVRRTRKELLRQTNPNLVASFKAFAVALNSNRPTDEIEELGDQLENAYHDARRGAS